MLKYLFLSLMLLSCAKQLESQVSSAYIPSISPFLNTAAHSEQDLAHFAYDQLKKGNGISTQNAEKCFQLEINRSGVQLQCAYLWAIEGGESSIADALLTKNALKSKEWAVAALIKKTGLKNIPFPEFLQILRNGEEQILPLLTKATEYRLDSNGGNPNDNKQLVDFFSKFQNDEKFFVPLLSLFWRLDKVSFYQLLNERCNSNFLDSAKMICWKSLIFHEAHGLQEDVKFAIRLKLPNSWYDPEWKKFRNLFPNRAIKIQKQFRE
jgi:hypothetical protein